MKEPKFIPAIGQVDYSNIRYAPVINTVIKSGSEVLLVKRSNHMRLYPGYWNGISGFLDDDSSIEDKVRTEIFEELAISPEAIKSIERGKVLLQEAPEYNKTWLVITALVELEHKADLKLDWEAEQAKWFSVDELGEINLLPGYENVLEQFV